MAQDIPVFPLADWDIGPLNDGTAILLRLRYLSTAEQAADEPNAGLMHAMSRDQAIELGTELLRLGSGSSALFTGA